MKIILFDNYDSFTYNLLHLVKELGYTDIDVFRNDRIDLKKIGKYDKIILSPGPGIPSEAGLLLPLIRQYASSKSMLGVCLGHQAIAEAFGATLINLPEVYHGVATKIQITTHDVLFDGLPREIEVGRYHSWGVSNLGLPNELRVTAVDEQGEVMAFRHDKYDVCGVQFHPESILTPDGKKIMDNFLRN